MASNDITPISCMVNINWLDKSWKGGNTQTPWWPTKSTSLLRKEGTIKIGLRNEDASSLPFIFLQKYFQYELLLVALAANFWQRDEVLSFSSTTKSLAFWHNPWHRQCSFVESAEMFPESTDLHILSWLLHSDRSVMQNLVVRRAKGTIKGELEHSATWIIRITN